MRLASITACLALTLAADAANFETEALIFGASYHFQNRDDYSYNELNPGVGLATWAAISERWSLGVVAGEFKNSYSITSLFAGGGARFCLGDTRGLHGGVYGAIGPMSGYGDTYTIPMGAAFLGYSRVRLHATYVPYRRGSDPQNPSSSSAQVWASVVLARW